MKRKVLVTGAGGFVGRHLCALLHARNFEVVGALRSDESAFQDCPYRIVSIGDIGGAVDWQEYLDGIDCVVHLASRVHVMKEVARDPLREFRRVNVFGSEQLLSSIGSGQIESFIYMSTIKVYGERSSNKPISVRDEMQPQDPYGLSKLEAERVVESLAREKGIPFTIIRPPLVYGPGVGGNFLRLMNLVDRGIPLPFGRIQNQRSMVYVQNLCDLVHASLVSDEAKNQKLIVSDNADVSTPELVRRLSREMSKPDRVISLPLGLLRAAGIILRRESEIDRLVESLVVDVSDTLRVLGWSPPYTLDQALVDTIDWYQNRKRGV